MEDSSSTLQQGNHPLSKKLKKILDTRLDNDKDMLEALKTVSTFFTDNNIRTRRNLRGEIERRSLLINQQFVDAFSHVVKDLESIHSDVQAMTACCKDMTDRLSATKEQTQELITKTSELKSEEQSLQVRSELAQAFLDRLQLKPDELKILRSSRDGILDPGFFKVLEKVQRIHSDVKVLLRTNHQTAGMAQRNHFPPILERLEIMEQMALQQESAYEQLYRWSQSQCRAMTSDSLDITPLQQQAMKALQNRPVLFRYALDEYATARRGSVVRGFIDALTRGIPGAATVEQQQHMEHKTKGPKPIELHAHDPLRYVGDMLAWLHQASASEKECLVQLLSDCAQGTDEASGETLSHVLEGACRPLKVRVEQVLVAEPGSLVLYKLTSLLKFYRDTICDIIGKGSCSEEKPSPLLETIDELHVLCRKLFFNSLQYLASKLLDKVELPPSDLSPPRTLTETLVLLRDIFDSHDASVASNQKRHGDLVQVMNQVLDPLLQMCAVSASQLPPADMATYVINSMHAAKFMLSLYEFTDQKIEMLSAQIDAHLDTLINEQTAVMLTRGGLASVYKSILKHENSKTPLSKIEGLERSALTSAFQHFDDVIHAPDDMLLPQISLLASATLKEVATSRANELVTSSYKVVYDVFVREENGYDARTFSLKTPEQVKLLLC